MAADNKKSKAAYGNKPNLNEDTIGEAFSESSTVAESNVVSNVCLFGTRNSKNGRTYTDQAINSIAKLAEGAKVYIDHQSAIEDLQNGGVRKLKSFLGALYGIEQRGEKVFAKEFKIHPLQMDWIKGLVEHFPDKAGFSINASGKVKKSKEATIVEDVTKIHSVDLVSSPATTSSFFEELEYIEDENKDIKNMSDEKKVTLDVLEMEYPHLIEAILAKSEQTKKLTTLEEEKKALSDVIVAKDEEIKVTKESIVEKDKVIADKDKEIVSVKEELQNVKVKLEGYEAKERMAEHEAMIAKVIKESGIPEAAITPSLKEILMSLNVKKIDDKEVTVEEQAKKLLDELKGILAKPPVVKHASGQEKIDEAGKISDEDFARILRKK